MSNDLTLDDLPQPEYDGAMDPDALDTDGDNPNEMSDAQFGLLCDRMRQNGWLGGPIITDTDGLIADGEHRWRAAKENDLAEVPVRQYDIDDATRRLWRQELNKIHGEHDTKRDALEYDYLLHEGFTDEVHELTKAAGEDLDELLAQIKLDGSKPAQYDYTPEHNVYFEDCVEGMRERLEDDSVDLIVADPPYGFDFTGRTDKVKQHESIHGADDWGVIESFLSESRRVLRDDGHIYVWCNWKHYGAFERLFRDRFEHHNTLVWYKNVYGLNDANSAFQYRPQHEWCMYGSPEGHPRDLDNGRSESDVLEFDKVSGQYDHPTEKPAELISHLIKRSSHPGELVLDPFMGSGTTAVAAIQNDRDYVGFEIDEENYREVIERRIGEAKRQREATINAEAD